MRGTLACSWCRRSKVKCIHDGTAPCRACRRTSRQSSCTLSVPRRKTGGFEPYHRSRARAEPEGRNAQDIVLDPENAPELIDPEGGRQSSEFVGQRLSYGNLTSTTVEAPLTCHVGKENPIRTTPLPILIEAGNHLIHSCPGVSFIHGPSFLRSLREGDFDELKVCAIIAVCSRLMPGLIAQHGSATRAGKHYADFVSGEIITRISQGPHVDTIQCLLLLSMYEWGECSGFSAWMYLGMAIRMSQALRCHTDLDNPTEPISPEVRVIRQETRNRTIWSCYSMDRLFSCGKDRTTTFDLARMQIPLPLGESDYAFGEIQEPHQTMDATITSSANGTQLPQTMENHFAIILQGVDIWATLSKWTADGGRQKRHGPEDFPWNPTSAWHKISDNLETWRRRQDDRVKYSPTRLAAQLHRGHPSAFAFINLLYYLCLMFLHRDFIPLLPLHLRSPTGPTEPPFFSVEAPAGWWEASARTLYHAADCVADILAELQSTNTQVMSPLVGFCAFTAALTHLHAAAFPQMSLDRSHGSAARAEICTAYLSDFAKAWKIGQDWVTTLNDARHLFKRALANKQKFMGRLVSLGDTVYEYGSIMSTQPSPSGVVPSLQDTAEGDGVLSRSMNAIGQGVDMEAGQIAPPDLPTSEIPETIDLDDEFWRTNESLLGQQYLNLFFMGNDASIFGDDGGLFVANQP